jgi:hypothetical protein
MLEKGKEAARIGLAASMLMNAMLGTCVSVLHLHRSKGKTSIVQECAGHKTTRFNADGGTRTHDLMLRRHALYPLSYVSMETV